MNVYFSKSNDRYTFLQKQKNMLFDEVLGVFLIRNFHLT